MIQVLGRTLAVLALIFCASLAMAQADARSENDPLYPFWDDAAESAEQIIDDAANSSTDDLEVLRSRLATFRNEFSKARSANGDRINTIQSQIAALGEVPEDGVEAAEITIKRTELEQELESFQAPIRVANAAFQRADGLISELDQVIRERRANRLLDLGPSPLDPRTWPVVFEDTKRMYLEMSSTVSVLNDLRRKQDMQDRLPLVVLLMLISLTVIANGRKWAGSAIGYMRRFGGRGTGVWI